MHNSKFWSILFFAFRFNFNMSQDPDSMQSPEQASDFDGDAWFLSSRRLKFVSVQCFFLYGLVGDFGFIFGRITKNPQRKTKPLPRRTRGFALNK